MWVFTLNSICINSRPFNFQAQAVHRSPDDQSQGTRLSNMHHNYRSKTVSGTEYGPSCLCTSWRSEEVYFS